MPDNNSKQGSVHTLTQLQQQDEYLDAWIEAFLFDRKAQNMAPGTLQYYRVKLKTFTQYCDGRAITRMNEITAQELRRFLVWLEETGHNPGGRHAVYRAIKTFLRWYEVEAEPENWRNPIARVQPPRVGTEPLAPIPLGDIERLLKTCDKSFLGQRDRAILLTLLDTGVRAQELLDINLADVNLINGTILIRQGKGRKPRFVYIGSVTRRAIRSYLKLRKDDLPALFVTDDGAKRLAYYGLRSVIVRRARLAGISPPGLHAFRRQFAITMLRAGVDLVTLSRLMGHSSLTVLQRYLKQLDEDLQIAHKHAGPVDNAKL